MGCGEVGVRVRGKASLTWDEACVKARFDPRKRGISEVKSNSVRQVRVEGGGGGVVAHVGLHALGLFADRLGVGASLSLGVRWGGERAPGHDRGKVLTQAMLMLAGGGECCSDIEYLRAEGALFADVASAPTLYRTLRSLDPATVGDLWARQAPVRAQIWARRAPVGATAPVVLDIDATLVEVHSEHKAGAAAHYKGGYGFHPLLCFSDDGDALGAVLRPGNAAANSIDDHIALLDAAIGRLPAEAAAGHLPGDDDALVTRPVVLRTDSAGCSVRIAEAARDRNVGFSVVARRNDAIDSAIAAAAVTDKRWQRAIKQNGQERPGAAVADLTEFVDTADWPDRTRLIVRREPRHRGAQRSLFRSDDWRYWGHWTDQTGPAAERDAHMRAHAVVEDHIAALKDAGLTRLPFGDFDANAAWVALVCWARTLVVWFQQLACAAGTLAEAAAKRLRWTLWHTPGRLTRSGRRTTIRLPTNHPGAAHLARIYNHIAALS